MRPIQATKDARALTNTPLITTVTDVKVKLGHGGQILSFFSHRHAILVAIYQVLLLLQFTTVLE